MVEYGWNLMCPDKIISKKPIDGIKFGSIRMDSFGIHQDADDEIYLDFGYS
jgi:hypothetical protein